VIFDKLRIIALTDAGYGRTIIILKERHDMLDAVV